MNIHIDGVPINQSNQSKSLGLVIDENLSWKISQPCQAAKMAIFELSAIKKKLKRFRTFEWYFRKLLTIEVIWAKYEEIRNFATVISFSVFTGTGS